MSSKRKDITYNQKQILLKQYDVLPKCSQRVAALKLEISQSTLCNLLKNRPKIEAVPNASRKRKKEGKAADIEASLLQWFKIAKAMNIPITRAILFDKAKGFARVLGNTDFVPTDGWLSRWKGRNCITYVEPRVKKQKKSGRDTSEKWFRESIPNILREFWPHQVFTAGVTGLLYRMPPEHMIFNCSPHKKDSLDEEIMEQITVLLTCNMDGSVKKTPLIIGRIRNPKCLKGMKRFPVEYVSNNDGCKALMTNEDFTNFLVQWDKDLLEEKIVLILKECVSHLPIELRNIKVVYLPTNTDSVLQPLDLGIVNTFKCHYRKDMLQKLSSATDSNVNISLGDVAKSISILDAMHMIRKAWRSVQPMTIYNSFKKGGFYTTYENGNDIESAEQEEVFEDTIKSYAEMDKFVQVVPRKMDKENNNTLPTSTEQGDASCHNEQKKEEEILESSSSSPTTAETLTALKTLRKTLECKGAAPECYDLFYEMESAVQNLIGENS